jgi:hypothetical protein
MSVVVEVRALFERDRSHAIVSASCRRVKRGRVSGDAGAVEVEDARFGTVTSVSYPRGVPAAPEFTGTLPSDLGLRAGLAERRPTLVGCPQWKHRGSRSIRWFATSS